MRHHHWEILTHGDEVVRGTDSMPKQGIRDAARAIKLCVKGVPLAVKMVLPHGADLIFFRATELKREVGFDGKVIRDYGEVVTYVVGWNLGGKKSCVEIGMTTERVGLFRKRIVPVSYVLLSDDDGREE